MRLSDEQELEVRQELAGRLNRLRKEPTTRTQNPFLMGWNEAIDEAVREVMGSDPIHVGVCRTPDSCLSGHTYKPGCRFRKAEEIVADGCDENGFMPMQRTTMGKRRKGGHAPIEDIPLPDPPDEDDPWDHWG